jgi:sec-independent protein translocase protein TatB
MFDVGFFEVVVIFVVALLVLGPERMPVAIRTVGLWVGRFKQQYRRIKQDIEREIGADDIRQQLHNERIMRELQATQAEIEQMRDQYQLPQSESNKES